MFKSLSIKAKLSILSIVSLILLAFSISYLAIQKSSEALLNDKFAQLSTIEVAKHGELKKYFDSLEELILTMASNKGKIKSYKNFKKGFDSLYKEQSLDLNQVREELKLDTDINYLNLVNYKVPHSQKKAEINEYIPHNLNGLIAQYIFITKNKAPVGQKDSFSSNEQYDSTYMQIHKETHKSFRKYLSSFKLYDLFFMDLEGNIIYTVYKQKDFGTNLNVDRYSDTGLARVYKQALAADEKKVLFEDFSPYEPSYNYPAAFIATPIFEKGKKIGVLAFQMSVENLNNIMQFGGQYERAGLGKTGECYLVGSDYLMRTDSRFQKEINDDIVQALGSTVGVLKIETKSTQAVMGGDESIGKWIIKDYRDRERLSLYHTVDIFNTEKWAILAEIDKEEALEPADELTRYLIGMTLVLLVISLAVTIIAIRKTVFKPLNSFQYELIHFFEFLKSESGDIKLIEVRSNDEIGKMSKFINEGIIEVQHFLSLQKDDDWTKEGIGKLNGILIDNSTLKDIVASSLRFIAKYLDASVGVIYLFNKEKRVLVQNATYSYTNTETTKLQYNLGEGVVGQVGLQKAPIILREEIRDNTDLMIQTGTSNKKPTSTFTYPLVYKKELYGVMELGSLSIFEHKKITFLNKAVEVVAISVATALQNEKVAALLYQTEKNNEQLQKQRQQLEEANTAMEEQQQQLEVANTNLEEQQQQLEEANALMEEQQQQLELQNHDLEKAKEEILKRADDLELSNKYKSEFLSNMSHELRTPLNAIILLSQLLVKNKCNNLQEDDIKKAQTIYTSGNELLRLINDILDLSKVEAGKIEIIVEEFDPNGLLENIQNLYSFNAREKGVELKVVNNYNDIISSDQNRISQILKNLISNSLKFTHEGNITLEINKIDDKQRPIRITVSDTGIGIPKEKQQLIFEAFTQADGTTSRKYGGTGLGLSITKELTHLLGGEISLESTENEGSTFTISLPNLNEHLLKQELPKIKQLTASSVKDDREILGTQSALLIIDDDVAFSEIVYETVKKNGHYGLVANSGKEGLSMLDRYTISGIMLDLTLPDMDGVDILKNIKADRRLQEIPVYIISSKDKDEKLLQLGAKGYGQKPLLEDDIEEIITALDQFIKDHDEIKKETKHETVILDEIDLEGINVLVVDDDIKNIFVLDNILNESNAKVFTAYNGKEALEQLRVNKEIDIVLMDIMMPVMDGYEAITAIRTDNELKTIPIIAVTAKAMKEDRDKCISVGADDFISKPIDMDVLVSLVKVWSDKKHQ